MHGHMNIKYSILYQFSIKLTKTFIHPTHPVQKQNSLCHSLSLLLHTLTSTDQMTYFILCSFCLLYWY
jgi:hypothetical protein